MALTAFIASSRENLRAAEALQGRLTEHGVEPTVWNQEVLGPSGMLLEELLDAIEASDFGVFIFAPDDVLKTRSETVATVRDNVLFELGLSMGRLGKERSFVVSPQGVGNLRVIPDLEGLLQVRYQADREDGNLAAALAPAARQIAAKMSALGRRYDRRNRGRTPNEPVELVSLKKIVLEKDYGSASFQVIQDDICKALTDVIVSSDDNHFRAQGGVSKAILDKTGPDVRRQLDYFESRIFRQGHLAITTGGDWKRRAVFHAAVIDLEENRYPTRECVSALTRRLLGCAVALGARSIALPVLGGGFGERGLTAADSVNAIATEVDAYLRQQQGSLASLTRVVLYVYREEDLAGLPRELAVHNGPEPPERGLATAR